MEDNEGDDEDFAINTESVVDPDANVVNHREADKSVENIASALPGTVRKGIDHADKGVCGVGKEVGDAVRCNGEVGNRVNDTDKGARAITSDFFGEVGKNVSD